jgi:N-formylglutamate deformylase
MERHMSWLEIQRGDAPLIVSMPHTGTEIPGDIEQQLVSPWLARKDADWWIENLYDFAPGLGATVLRTTISRTVIDVNRDPSGKSLYPGLNTTELCPTSTFDGEPLYRNGIAPTASEIAERRAQFFDPYHAALKAEITRLRKTHDKIVLFEAHSIRSVVPRLFDGELPNFNIGTNSGASCAQELTASVESLCAVTEFSWTTNGRFKGGFTTRHYGLPADGVHAIQMELADRGYIDETEVPSPENWPTPYREPRAAALRAVLKRVLQTCITFAAEDQP